MVSNLVNPTAVEICALVNFHDVLRSVEMFAAKYPDERMCVEQAERLEAAASVIRQRLAARCVALWEKGHERARIHLPATRPTILG